MLDITTGNRLTSITTWCSRYSFLLTYYIKYRECRHDFQFGLFIGYIKDYSRDGYMAAEGRLRKSSEKGIMNGIRERVEWEPCKVNVKVNWKESRMRVEWGGGDTWSKTWRGPAEDQFLLRAMGLISDNQAETFLKVCGPVPAVISCEVWLCLSTQGRFLIRMVTVTNGRLKHYMMTGSPIGHLSQ